MALSGRISASLRSLERILDSLWASLFSKLSTPLPTGKRAPPQQTQDTKMQERQPTPNKRLIRTVEWVIGLTSLAVALAGFWLSYIVPKLSVDVTGSLQPTNPLGTIFYLRNEGSLPVHNILVTCGHFNVRATSYSIIGPGEIILPDSRAEILSPGHKMDLPCAHAIGFTAPTNFTEAEMTIKASFRPDYVPWHKTETFPWKAERTQRGEWIWKSLPQ
jgi:hypothetical protein